MADNKKKKGWQDRCKVDSKDPGEITWLAGKYPHLDTATIMATIKKAGPSRKSITSFLQKKAQRVQQQQHTKQ